MIYVTGDTHGDIKRFKSSGLNKLKKNDYLIVCGDFGFIWDDSKQEKNNIKFLAGKKYQILFVEGAHENYELLEEYPIVDYCGGKARKIRDNIYQLIRGNVFEIDDKKILAFGGGDDEQVDVSDIDDKYVSYRIPSDEECDNTRTILDKNGYSVDFIISHDVGFKMRSLLNMDSNCFTNLHAFLNEISEKCTFKKWYFGCFHMDKNISSSYCAVYTRICEIDSSSEI